MSLFASHRAHTHHDDLHAARTAAEDVQSLLRSLEHAIQTLTDEGGHEADHLRRTLRIRADQLRRVANRRAHQARERVDWARERTQETISAAPFKSVGVAVAIGAVVGLAIALTGNGRHLAEEE